MGQQNGRLGQRPSGFMDGDGGHVRPCVHRGLRAAGGMEIIMGAMGLIDEDRHVVLMGELNQGSQIRHRAEIGGVDDEDRLRRWILKNRFLPRGQRRLVGDFQSGIDLRHDVGRDGAGENQGVDD